MPRGSHFSCFAKKSNQKKATPTIVLILRCSEKSGTARTRCAQIAGRSYRFFLPLLGANQRGPVEPIFDRFAMRRGVKVRVQPSNAFASRLASPRTTPPRPVRPERSEGSDALRKLVCHGPLMPRGSHFSCFAKKSNQKKATPTIGLFLRCSEKSGTKKTRFAQTVFRSSRFFPPLLGANQRGPVEPIFDRFAMRRGVKVRVRPSDAVASRPPRPTPPRSP